MDFLVFLHCYHNKGYLCLVFYDPKTRTIEERNISFENWYFSSQPANSNQKPIEGLVFSDGTPTGKIYKNNIGTAVPSGDVYERNIPLSVRFETFYGWRFLEVVTRGKLIKRPEMYGKIPIPLTLWDCRTNAHLDFLLVGKKLTRNNLRQPNEPGPQIVVKWKRSTGYVRGSIRKELVLSLHDLCRNFLRIGSNMHEKHIKIAPLDYYVMREEPQNPKCFGLMEELVKKYFVQILHICELVPVPIVSLFTRASKNFLFSYIYLSGARKHGIVFLSPKKLDGFKSNAFHHVKKTNRIYSGNGIIGLDFDSMYPSVMLNLFTGVRHLAPLVDMIRDLLPKKRGEPDPLKRGVYKLILNGAIYGAIGQSKDREQFLIRSNPAVAGKVCARSSHLVRRTKERALHLGCDVIYCNTDSIVSANGLRDFDLDEWSRIYKVPLKREFVCTKFMAFNKNCRITESACFGWMFNSLLKCGIVRRNLQRCVTHAISLSQSFEEFVKRVNEYKPAVPERIPLEDLVYIKKNGLEIEYWTYLYNSITDKMVEVEFKDVKFYTRDHTSKVFEIMWTTEIEKLKSYIRI